MQSLPWQPQTALPPCSFWMKWNGTLLSPFVNSMHNSNSIVSCAAGCLNTAGVKVLLAVFTIIRPSSGRPLRLSLFLCYHWKNNGFGLRKNGFLLDLCPKYFPKCFLCLFSATASQLFKSFVIQSCLLRVFSWCWPICLKIQSWWCVAPLASAAPNMWPGLWVNIIFWICWFKVLM